jgi:hypothetical protein
MAKWKWARGEAAQRVENGVLARLLAAGNLLLF